HRLRDIGVDIVGAIVCGHRAALKRALPAHSDHGEAALGLRSVADASVLDPERPFTRWCCCGSLLIRRDPRQELAIERNAVAPLRGTFPRPVTTSAGDVLYVCRNIYLPLMVWIVWIQSLVELDPCADAALVRIAPALWEDDGRQIVVRGRLGAR